MIPRTARRTALTVLFALASCNVYDSSLLRGHGGSGSNGGGGSGAGSNGGTSTAGTEPDDAGASTGGSAGTQGGGSSSGSGGVSGSANGGTDNLGGEPPAMGGDGGMNDGGAGSGGGGTAGSAGKAGAGGMGGSNAGNGGNGGSGGTPPATGCAKLSVPIDASNDKSHFLIALTSPQDLSTGTISVRFYVQAGVAGSILVYVQDANFAFLGRALTELNTFDGWSVINWDVGAQAVGGSSIAKNNIKRVGIEINAAPATAGWSNPTVVYLDSITVKTTSFPFDASASVSTTAGSTDQSGQVLWFNNGSSDSTATGSVTWQASCP